MASRIIVDCNDEVFTFIENCPREKSICGGQATVTWKYCEEFCPFKKKQPDEVCEHLRKEIMKLKKGE